MGSALNRRQRYAVLVELSPDHGPILFSQCLLLLEEGFDVTVVVHQSNRDLELLLTLEDRIRITVVSGRPLGLLLAVMQEQMKNRADIVTINTLNCRSLWLTAMVTLGPLSIVLHNLDNFGSGRKRALGFLARLLLFRSKKIIVLSPKLKERAFQILPGSAHHKVSVFFPMFYGNFGEEQDRGTSNAPKSRLTVVIPGSVGSRRNYRSLVAVLPQLADTSSMDRVVIKVLGDSSSDEGRWLRRAIAEVTPPGRIIVEASEGYLSHQEFFDQIAGADYILPLIDNRVIEEWGYNRTSAPSSVMWSRAFSVPLICSTDFDLDDDLRPFSLMYEGEQVWNGLVAAVQAQESGTLVRMKRTMLNTQLVWRKAASQEYLHM